LLPVTFVSLAYQTGQGGRVRGLKTILIGDGENMKKVLITGLALCFMGLAVPSYSASRQDQMQQDQMKKDDAMKKDDGMKHDDMSKDTMAKDSKSKKKMKKDNMKKDNGMKHDDMSKEAPKS
jgi:pentapeptide MXKDX repeat protein